MTSLLVSMGSVIDGFVIGHTMMTKEVGAYSLQVQLNFLTNAFLWGWLSL